MTSSPPLAAALPREGGSAREVDRLVLNLNFAAPPGYEVFRSAAAAAESAGHRRKTSGVGRNRVGTSTCFVAAKYV